MNDLDELIRILVGSKSFKMDGSILELQNYYTGKTIKLDLGLLVEEYPEIAEEIIVSEEE